MTESEPLKYKKKIKINIASRTCTCDNDSRMIYALVGQGGVKRPKKGHSRPPRNLGLERAGVVGGISRPPTPPIPFPGWSSLSRDATVNSLRRYYLAAVVVRCRSKFRCFRSFCLWIWETLIFAYPVYLLRLILRFHNNYIGSDFDFGL